MKVILELDTSDAADLEAFERMVAPAAPVACQCKSEKKKSAHTWSAVKKKAEKPPAKKAAEAASPPGNTKHDKHDKHDKQDDYEIELDKAVRTATRIVQAEGPSRVREALESVGAKRVSELRTVKEVQAFLKKLPLVSPGGGGGGAVSASGGVK